MFCFFPPTTIITLEAVVFSKSLKYLFPLSGNCRYIVHMVHQHRVDSLQMLGGEKKMCLLQLSNVSAGIVHSLPTATVCAP